MMDPVTLHLLAQGSAERLVDCLVEGFALAVFAWTLLRLSPRVNAATRFAVWFATLLATALLPLLSGGSAGAVSTRSLVTLPASWAVYLFGAWVLLASAALARVGYGFLQLRRIRRSSSEVDINRLDPAVAECLGGSRRAARLLVSDSVSVPTAIGFLRPAVVLPERLLRELPAEDLRQVLLHELAHLRRWDDWSNALQQIVKAVLCFHPAVWWLERRIALEREMACDDAVIAATAQPRAYAECLARLAENSALRRSVSLAQAAVTRVRQLTARVTRILDGQHRTAAAPKKWAVSLVGVFSLVCAAVAWQAPQLLSFTNSDSSFASMHSGPADAVVNEGAPAAPAIAAKYVPQTTPVHVTRSNATAVAVQKTSRPAHDPAHVLRVKAKRRSQATRVLQAKAVAPDAARGVVMVYVVEARDSAGGATWQVCLWQWTVTAPAQRSSRTSI